MCTEETCERRANGLLLNKVEQVRVVYVSLEHGTMPAYDVAMHCERACYIRLIRIVDVNVEWLLGCKITYHHNYKLRDNERIYYDYIEGLPDAIQVGTHHYVDIGVGQLWKTMMHVAWCVCILVPSIWLLIKSQARRQLTVPEYITLLSAVKMSSLFSGLRLRSHWTMFGTLS